MENKNQNSNAFPVVATSEATSWELGLTKREWFAGMALSMTLRVTTEAKEAAALAIYASDEILKQLDQQ